MYKVLLFNITWAFFALWCITSCSSSRVGERIRNEDSNAIVLKAYYEGASVLLENGQEKGGKGHYIVLNRCFPDSSMGRDTYYEYYAPSQLEVIGVWVIQKDTLLLMPSIFMRRSIGLNGEPQYDLSMNADTTVFHRKLLYRNRRFIDLNAKIIESNNIKKEQDQPDFYLVDHNSRAIEQVLKGIEAK